MNSKAILLDGYVDEPACLGVPPYISPYIREMAGVLLDHGREVRYRTIDQLRADPALFSEFDQVDLVVMIAGLTVPGAYIGGKPATLTEIGQIGALLRHPKKVLGGPILFGYAAEGGKRAVRQPIPGFDITLSGSPAEALDSYLAGGEPRGEVDYGRADRWFARGASIITQHPSFPYLMCELETGRGCPRTIVGGCSFCTERLYGLPRYRSIAGIAEEVEALYRHGARHFRLGRQPDLLVYGADGAEYPRPRPELLEALFTAIRSAAPDLSTLHIDNVNPGTIAHHEEASREALRAILRGHTPGDVAAFGMETADPAVVQANNLKAFAEDVLTAIRIVNEEGGSRHEGVPELLPGLNFVLGLAGETVETYRLNRRFLEALLAEGLLVRRVNIRQVMPFPGTPAYERNTLGRHETQFRQFKEWVRQHFDLPMLRRVFPLGTVLRNVVVEVSGPLSFGRQMGSYPLLVGLPLQLPLRTVLDAVVVDFGMRSVTALPYPIEVNRIPLSALKWIPHVGKKKAGLIAARRPFKSLEEFRAVVGATPLDDALAFRPL